MITLLLGLVMAGPLWAQDQLAPIDVVAHEGEPVRWKEVESTRILSGKKNKATKTDLLPPIATDNLRQYFSQNAGVLTPEQSTEPWTTLSVRGVGDPHEAQNVLILQDGLPVGIDMYGSGGQYYSPPAPMMEEIEVINGGSALLYGPQPAGAINFRSPTLTPETPFGGKVGLTYGSYNLMSTVNTIKGKSGRTAYWGGYYRKQGDGLQHDNADFFAHSLQLKSHTFLENGNVFKFALQGYDSDFGQAGGMTRDCGAANANCWDRDGSNRRTTRHYDRLAISRALSSLGYEQKLSDRTTIESTLWLTTYRRYSSTQNTSGSNFGTRPSGTTNANREVDSHGFNFESRLRHDWGSEEQANTLSAGVLSYNTNQPTTSWTGQGKDSIRGTVSGRSLNTSRVMAVFAENRFNFGKLALIPGARLENINLESENRLTDVSRKKTFNVALGGLGASYEVTHEMQAYANASQGFKPIGFGTVLQQADPNVVVKGDIKPSYVYNYELGLRSDNKSWTWDVSGYWIQYQNQLASTSSGGITTLFNGRNAVYRGIEASVTRKNILESLDLYANMNYLDAMYHGGELDGKTPLYTPRQTVKYGAIYRHKEAWRASLLATYVSDHYANDTHSANFYIPSYQIFDLLGEARLGKNWSVNGAVNNLLDKTYYSRVMATGILPTMGRNYYVGANYRF